MRLDARLRKLEATARHFNHGETRTALLMRLALEACAESERPALAALMDRVNASTATDEEMDRFAAFCDKHCPPAVMLLV